MFFCHFSSHVCGQENWFLNQSIEYFFVNIHFIPTISIAHNITHEVRYILFQINGHKLTSRSEVIGLGSWARVGAEQTMVLQIAGFFPKFLFFISTITFEVCGVRNLVYLFL